MSNLASVTLLIIDKIQGCVMSYDTYMMSSTDYTLPDPNAQLYPHDLLTDVKPILDSVSYNLKRAHKNTKYYIKNKI